MSQGRSWRWRTLISGVSMALLIALMLQWHGGPASTAQAQSRLSASKAAAPGTGKDPSTGSTCQLASAGNQIQHVIYVQFDNVHFTRDNPNVPSDLEQMPNLLNFIESNGVLDSNHHTPLISHTADDILTSLTGNYPEQVGQPVANSYGYFKGDGSVGFASSFTYWTDKAPDGTNSLLTSSGKNAPAPWVAYTRSGCSVGAASIANLEIENTTTDLTQIFGSIPSDASGAAGVANYEGIAIHCGTGDTACAAATGARSDVLPDEPGGYTGFEALYGHKYVQPYIAPSGLNDLAGNPITGFPGFGGISAAQTLAYMAAMEEHNVPVVYGYISDAHDNHSPATFNSTTNPPTFGPGEAGYVAQLKAYDDAWGKFFARLKADGIDRSNTLFVFTSDENDHFVGGKPSNAGYDGIHTACQYGHVVCPGNASTPCPADNVGEIDANLAGLLTSQTSISTPFSVHSDSAPTVYIVGNPGQTDATITRPFERAVGQLTAANPLTANTDTLSVDLADQAEEKLEHMVTADPARTPTFTMFADPDYFFHTGAANCAAPGGSFTSCSKDVNQLPGFAWNHGDVQPEITTTWLGMVGPGIKQQGVRSDVFSDHTDIRPTMLELLGLKDDYAHQGRALIEFFDPSIEPQTLHAHSATLINLDEALKQINAPVGQLGLASLKISTAAVESGSGSSDTLYQTLDGVIGCITTQRNTIAGQMLQSIEGAEFNGQALDEQQAKSLLDQAQNLLQLVNQDAASPQNAACS